VVVLKGMQRWMEVNQKNKGFVAISMWKCWEETVCVCVCVWATTPVLLLSLNFCAMLKNQQQMAMKGLYVCVYVHTHIYTYIYTHVFFSKMSS